MSTTKKDTFKNEGIILDGCANLSASAKNLEAALKEFTTVAQKKNFSKIDALISADFLDSENKEFSVAVPGKLISLEVPMTEKALIAQLVKDEIYQEYALLTAIKKATEAVDRGVMDGDYPRPISIYLENKRDKKTWKLYLSKISDETLTLVVVECRLDVKENPGAFGSVGKKVLVKEKVVAE